jgi:hypothetical protein
VALVLVTFSFKSELKARQEKAPENSGAADGKCSEELIREAPPDATPPNNADVC